MGGLGYLAPGDDVNLLVLKKFPEGQTSEEIEIALPPGGAPGIALAGCSLHFAVSESKVNDKFGDSGLKVFETVDVKGVPFFRWDVGGHCDGVVNDDIAGTKTGFEIRAFSKPIPSDKKRQFVLMR